MHSNRNVPASTGGKQTDPSAKHRGIGPSGVNLTSRPTSAAPNAGTNAALVGGFNAMNSTAALNSFLALRAATNSGASGLLPQHASLLNPMASTVSPAPASFLPSLLGSTNLTTDPFGHVNSSPAATSMEALQTQLLLQQLQQNPQLLLQLQLASPSSDMLGYLQRLGGQVPEVRQSALPLQGALVGNIERDRREISNRDRDTRDRDRTLDRDRDRNTRSARSRSRDRGNRDTLSDYNRYGSDLSRDWDRGHDCSRDRHRNSRLFTSHQPVPRNQLDYPLPHRPDNRYRENRAILVYNLPCAATEQEIDTAFNIFGKVSHIRIVPGIRGQRYFKKVVVEYMVPEHAAKAHASINSTFWKGENTALAVYLVQDRHGELPPQALPSYSPPIRSPSSHHSTPPSRDVACNPPPVLRGRLPPTGSGISDEALRESRKTWSPVKVKPGCTIYIGGLPLYYTKEDIISLFSKYGEVIAVRMMFLKDSFKGAAFLDYSSPDSASEAVDQMDRYRIGSRILTVNLDPKYISTLKKKEREERERARGKRDRAREGYEKDRRIDRDSRDTETKKGDSEENGEKEGEKKFRREQSKEGEGDNTMRDEVEGNSTKKDEVLKEGDEREKGANDANNRREGYKRERSDQNERSGKREGDADRRDSGPERRSEPERLDSERRESDRRDGNRREIDRNDNTRRETERRETDRKVGDRRESERRESNRKEGDRKEPERKEIERRDTDRRDTDRRTDYRRTDQKRDSVRTTYDRDRERERERERNRERERDRVRDKGVRRESERDVERREKPDGRTEADRKKDAGSGDEGPAKKKLKTDSPRSTSRGRPAPSIVESSSQGLIRLQLENLQQMQQQLEQLQQQVLQQNLPEDQQQLQLQSLKQQQKQQQQLEQLLLSQLAASPATPDQKSPQSKEEDRQTSVKDESPHQGRKQTDLRQLLQQHRKQQGAGQPEKRMPEPTDMEFISLEDSSAANHNQSAKDSGNAKENESPFFCRSTETQESATPERSEEKPEDGGDKSVEDKNEDKSVAESTGDMNAETRA